MRYDDPSICQVFGACLPIDTEPLILVREYFKFGPLDAFLRDHKQQLKVYTIFATFTFWIMGRKRIRRFSQ